MITKYKRYVVYFYYNEQELIYVGRTKNNVGQRFKEHRELWMSEVTKIGIRTYQNNTSMVLCETYYIDKLKPKYNEQNKTTNILEINILDPTELEVLSREDFIDNYCTNQQSKITTGTKEDFVDYVKVNKIGIFDYYDFDNTVFIYEDYKFSFNFSLLNNNSTPTPSTLTKEEQIKSYLSGKKTYINDIVPFCIFYRGPHNSGGINILDYVESDYEEKVIEMKFLESPFINFINKELIIDFKKFKSLIHILGNNKRIVTNVEKFNYIPSVDSSLTTGILDSIVFKDIIINKPDFFIDLPYKLITLEFKLLQMIFSNIKPNDTTTYSYTFKIKEFIEFLDLKGQSLYNEVKKVSIDFLLKSLILFSNDTKFYCNWLSIVEYKHQLGMITLKNSAYLDPFLLSKEYTTYNLSNTIKFKSIYTLRIYELLKLSAKKNKSLIFSLTQLRTILGIENEQYPSYSNLKQRVLLKAQNELKSAESDITFSFSEIKIGRSVKQLKFQIYAPPL